MLVRSKFFSEFVEKIEKFKVSLSKQHNKMLKMRSEMLKTRKKAKSSSSGKFPESRGFLGFREFPGKFFENFQFKNLFRFPES